MPVSFPEIRKFLGLFAQQNSFDTPDGAMEKALNVVINDDNVISKLRGFYQYFSPGSGTLKALARYQNKLISVYSDKICYYTDTGTSPNETGTESVLTGDTISVTGSRVPQFVEANGNLFLTTDTGVKVIDAYSGKVFPAGAPGGLDVDGSLLPSSGPLIGNCQVGYRVLFGRRDANNNLIIGAPSDFFVLTNGKKAGTYTSVAGFTVTVTVTGGHNLSSGMTVVITDASDTDANGTKVVTVTSLTTFTYTTSADPSSGTLNFSAARRAIVEFSLPDSITSATDGWFYQLYRSGLSSGETVTPEINYKLVDEIKLTSGDLTAGLVTYEDNVDEFLVAFASELYTNPNSREGEDQANTEPPLCDDIAVFNDFMFCINTKSKDIVYLDMEDTSVMVDGDFLEVDIGGSVERIVARQGVGNLTSKVDSFTNNAGALQFNVAGHNFLNGYTIYVSAVSGGSLAGGTYYIVNKTAGTFEISLTSGGGSVAYSAVTFCFIQGVTDGTYGIFILDKISNASNQLQNTGKGIVKAINRLSTANIAGNYVSSINDIPGKMRFTSTVFGVQVKVRANTTTVGSGFFPKLGTSFGASDVVKTTSDTEPNSVSVSKIAEPWAVPIVNKFYAGSRNQGILRGVALRNSMIMLKLDGVYKLTGDTPSNFTVTLIDNTVRAISRKSAAATANQVYFLASEGVCVATDSSVEIVSRRIENRFENIVGLSNIDDQTSAVAYDTDRTYRICTIAPNQTTASAVYLHNSINDTWTESDTLFTGGEVGPGNVLFLISGNKIVKERKNQNRIDFCGQNVVVTVVSVAADKLSAVVSMVGTPIIGDLVEKSGLFSRIDAVANSGANFLLSFLSPTNILAADTPWLYRGYTSQWMMTPFHAGSIGRSKQFSQLQLHTRTPSITRIKADFIGNSFGGDKTTEWKAARVSGGDGWGESPWGFFSWGLDDGIRNIYDTEPAPIVRLYVPLFQARSTFLKAILTHREAGESIDCQALTWAVRGYNERVTK